jgi:glycosyltransferase involved in cell wall biosynthesis
MAGSWLRILLLETILAQTMPINVVAWPGLKEKSENPYTWLVYQPMAAMGANVVDFSFYKPMPSCVDILHIHWPEGIFWNRFSRRYPWLARLYAERLTRAIFRVRRVGGAIVWTSHNLQPHEQLHPVHQRIWKDFFPRFRSMIDLVISLTPEAERMLREAYPDLEGKRRAVVPHPHYRSAYPKPMSVENARASLGIPLNDFVLCCIGSIRPSKGILEFAELYTRIAVSGERLIIAGACDDSDYLARLSAIAAEHAGAIDLRIGRVADETMIAMLSAVDLTVTNFRRILNSGSVLLSLSYDTPVCGPALGSLSNIARRLGDDWMMELPQPLSAGGLRAIIERAKLKAMKRRSQHAPLPADMEPKEVASCTLREYGRAIKDRHVRKRLAI